MNRTIIAAAAALMRQRLRTLLTTLGISIGVAAVICTVSLGAGSAAAVDHQLDNLGEDFLWIAPGSVNAMGVRTGSGSARTLVDEDAFAIAREVPEVAMCTPEFDGRAQVIAGNQNWNTRYIGAAPELFEIRRWQLAAGTFFAEFDVARRNRVAVLGPAVAAQVFGGENPVGRVIRLDRVNFQVLGVLQSKGASTGGLDRDDVVYMPYTTARQHFYDREWIDGIYCSVRNPALMASAEAGAASVLRWRHDLDPEEDDDFTIRRPEVMITLRAESARTMALMLTAIAAVSLVVGGVGVMNIMLVSVTERTREIGLRLAVGARVSNIRMQFLVEAALLGMAGGALGLALGWIASSIMAGRFGWVTILSPEATITALATAGTVGLIFGYYPAHRASALDPIEALRNE